MILVLRFVIKKTGLPNSINLMIPMLNVHKFIFIFTKAGCLFDKNKLKLHRLRNFQICAEMCAKEIGAYVFKRTTHLLFKITLFKVSKFAPFFRQKVAIFIIRYRPLQQIFFNKISFMFMYLDL